MGEGRAKGQLIVGFAANLRVYDAMQIGKSDCVKV